MGVVPVPGPAPGAKPSADNVQHSTSKPVNGNSNASAAAAAAAASTAAAGASESIWTRWGTAAQKHIAELQIKADVASKEFQKQAKSIKLPKKWEMPVHVDVDVIGPQMETLKNAAIEVWGNLPPAAQRYLPYAGSAAAGALVTHKLQQRRVQRDVARMDRLRDKVNALTQENEALSAKLAKKLPGSSSDNELRMAAAVAKATAAAAQASNAAAHAAEAAAACVITRGRAPPAA